MINLAEAKLNVPPIVDAPYDVLEAIRGVGSPIWSDAHKSWLVGSHEDVVSVLGNPAVSAAKMDPFVASREGELRDKLERMQRIFKHWVVFNDPPTHTRLRRVLQQCFMPRDIRGFEAAIRSTAVDLLDAVEDGEPVDFVERIASQFPGIVIGDLFGVPRDDMPLIQKWSQGISKFIMGSPNSSTKYDETLTDIEAMHDYFQARLAELSASERSGDDLLSRLLDFADKPEGMTHEEIVSTLVLILFAGNETTVNFLSNSLYTLANADMFDRLRADPAAIPGALEECLRFEGPAPLIVKVAKDDVQVRSTTIPAGSRIMVLLGSANRDAKVFDEAGTFRREADTRGHVAFGRGIHFCMGAPLARLEGRVLFEELINRFDIELVQAQLRWREELLSRGPKELPVRMVRRG